MSLPALSLRCDAIRLRLCADLVHWTGRLTAPGSAVSLPNKRDTQEAWPARRTRLQCPLSQFVIQTEGDAHGVRMRRTRSARQVVAPIIHAGDGGRCRNRCYGEYPSATGGSGRRIAKHRTWRQRDQRDPRQGDEGSGFPSCRSGDGLRRSAY